MKRELWSAALLACFIAARSPAAFERQPESVRACGMGGAGLAIAGNVWGGLMNPAGLARAGERVIAVSGAPAPFGLQELRRVACAYCEPFGRFTASLAGIRYGYELYREVTLCAACGVDCGAGLRAGLALTVNSLSIPAYGRGSCIGLDAGMLCEITRGLTLGASASNVNSPSPGPALEIVPRSFQAGIAFAGADCFIVACDVAQDPRFPAEVRMGAEYTFLQILALRAGISTEPAACSAGVGIRLLGVEIEYAFSRHQELGFTHRFGLSLHLGGS